MCDSGLGQSCWPENNYFKPGIIEQAFGGATALWVFREGKKQVCTRRLARELHNLIRSSKLREPDGLIDILIRSGELEAGLADLGCPAAAVLENLTDLAACAVFGEGDLNRLSACGAWLEALELPTRLFISPPEGFAYYALHPAAFAETAATMVKPGTRYAVVGIRSIGTTLSAVVTAALKQRGAFAERITVRPTGHPYSRVTALTRSETEWVHTHLALDAEFLVVDEGPGLSGSSFLSVGEALLQAGIPCHRVSFLGSREPDVNALRARDAVERWSRFNWRRAQGNAFRSVREYLYLGGGTWRAVLLNRHSDWPASWTQMERLKFLSPDRKWLLKFEGLGRFGQKAQERAACLYEGGFGCELHEAGDGLMAYPFVSGPPLNGEHLSPAVLDRMAAYCAFRAGEFRVAEEPVQQLEEMFRFNLVEEFGGGEAAAEMWDANPDSPDVLPEISTGALANANPVLVDGRMQPHEWLMLSNGTILKTDATSHGDDHFFPGPTDIAWDLAGAIVEWQMDSHTAESFLTRYTRLSGDDPRPRISVFLLAYTVFRMGYSKMASEAEAGTAEESRLRNAYESYRERLKHQLSLLFHTTDLALLKDS
jgi:hypothetical protein